MMRVGARPAAGEQAGAGPTAARRWILWGEGVELIDDGIIVAVIFCGGHHTHGPVAGAKDDNRDH